MASEEPALEENPIMDNLMMGRSSFKELFMSMAPPQADTLYYPQPTHISHHPMPTPLPSSSSTASSLSHHFHQQQHATTISSSHHPTSSPFIGLRRDASNPLLVLHQQPSQPTLLSTFSTSHSNVFGASPGSLKPLSQQVPSHGQPDNHLENHLNFVNFHQPGAHIRPLANRRTSDNDDDNSEESDEEMQSGEEDDYNSSHSSLGAHYSSGHSPSSQLNPYTIPPTDDNFAVVDVQRRASAPAPLGGNTPQNRRRLTTDSIPPRKRTPSPSQRSRSNGLQGKLHFTDPAEEQDKKTRRLMRNRQAAKESRRKKKEYVGELEGRLSVLEDQISRLSQVVSKYRDLYGELQEA